MILDKIAAATKKRVEEQKQKISYLEIREKAMLMPAATKFPLEQALKSHDISFICEVKRASPSKGIIAPDFPYVQIAEEYQEAGAAAISVLTEPEFFLGKNEYLTEISRKVNLPVIRKDFIIDAYQIYEAKVIGASCVLLICALLPKETISEYIEICDMLGLSALVEVHDEKEAADAVAAGARIIGVNNRNLKTFEVDIQNSIRLRQSIPEQILFVAESGIRTPEDIERLRQAGADGVLIGEAFMRCPDKKREFARLKGERTDKSVKVKICGLQSVKDVEIVNRYLPEYAGFVFAESKRKVTDQKALEMRKLLDKRIQTVGVFVNEPTAHIVDLCRRNIIDIIQLHGDEEEACVNELQEKTGKPVIRVIRVTATQQIIQQAESKADYLLLDTYKKGTYGGSGESFSPELIPKLEKTYFLAGGLSPENVREAIQNTTCYCVDVSSGVETGGRKDEEKIRRFIEAVRKTAV